MRCALPVIAGILAVTLVAAGCGSNARNVQGGGAMNSSGQRHTFQNVTLPHDPIDGPMWIHNMRPGQLRDALDKGYGCLVPIGRMRRRGDDEPFGIDAGAMEGRLMALARSEKAIVASPLWYTPAPKPLTNRRSFQMAPVAFARYLDAVLKTLLEVGFDSVTLVTMDEADEDDPLKLACYYARSNRAGLLWHDGDKGTGWWERSLEDDRFEGPRIRVFSLAEAAPEAPAARKPFDTPPTALRLEHMTATQLDDAVNRGLPLFVPIGVVENHGNHCPLGVDVFEAQHPVLLAAEKAPAVVAPAIWYGPTGYMVSGPELGTTEVEGDVYREYTEAFLHGLARMGFTKIVFVQVHQGRTGMQATASRLAGLKVANLYNSVDATGGESGIPLEVRVIRPPQGEYDHAGKNETSWMLHLKPDHTDMSLLRKNDYAFCWQPHSPAQDATAAWGRTMTDRSVEGLVALIRELTGATD